MESKGIRGGGSQQVDPAGPASLSPKSLALSRQIDSHANMAICHARAQSPMPSFLPQTTTPKLAAYIYTPARVPAGPRCPAAHGLAHRSGVPFFSFFFFLPRSGELAVARSCTRRGEQTVLEKQGTCSSTRRRRLGPWAAAAGLAALHAWSPQHVRSFSNMASRPNHRQFAGRPCAMGGLIGHRRRGGLLAWTPGKK